MNSIKKYYQNENGNIALFVIAALSMMMVLFVFVFNMGAALVAKEESSTVAKQASLAATSSFYEQVRSSVSGLVKLYGDPENPEIWSFDQEWNAGKLSCSPNDAECLVNVLEGIIIDAFGLPFLDGFDLRLHLIGGVSLGQIINDTRNNITSNDGTTEGATLTIEDNRFKVEAAAVFESISYGDDYLEGNGNKHLNGIRENIYRDSQGPEIALLRTVLFPFENRTYSLD